MSARVERHVERLADRILLKIVTTILQAFGRRLQPESLQLIRDDVEGALREAATAGKLDTLHPAQTFGPDQSMIDTRPMPRRPPPLPKKNDP